jgi:uncharacterized membrane protein
MVAAAGTAAVAGIATAALAEVLRRRNAEGGPAAPGRPSAAAVTVDVDPDTAYRAWRDLPKLPLFMLGLREVRTLDPTHSRWTADGPGGDTVTWDVEITADEPGRLIAWRTLPGAGSPGEGRVTFTAAASGKGTEVRLERPRGRAREDLRRFKQLVETGTVDRPEPAAESSPWRRLKAIR